MLSTKPGSEVYIEEGVAGDIRFPRPFQSLRLYLDSKMLDFQHLPEAGGILDQDAHILDDWRIIRQVDGEIQQEESK